MIGLIAACTIGPSRGLSCVGIGLWDALEIVRCTGMSGMPPGYYVACWH